MNDLTLLVCTGFGLVLGALFVIDRRLAALLAFVVERDREARASKAADTSATIERADIGAQAPDGHETGPGLPRLPDASDDDERTKIVESKALAALRRESRRPPGGAAAGGKP
jgi:hypothetical protein